MVYLATLRRIRNDAKSRLHPLASRRAKPLRLLLRRNLFVGRSPHRRRLLLSFCPASSPVTKGELARSSAAPNSEFATLRVTVQLRLNPRPSRLESARDPLKRIIKFQQTLRRPGADLQLLHRFCRPIPALLLHSCPVGGITCRRKSWRLGAPSTKRSEAAGPNIVRPPNR